MQETGYDIIGDIHGHGTELLRLLDHLGYEPSDTGYQHPVRKALFLGDFIDRGEDLREHTLVLETVMPMVRNGHALAVMGNHEFNALAFHTEVRGKPLREHNEKNLKQHRAFLNEYQNDPIAKAEALAFFYELPLWLELDGLRVIHACWSDKHIDKLKQQLPGNRLTKQYLIEAASPGTFAYNAIETILKGFETKLPDGINFKDKDGHIRTDVRIAWWNRGAMTLMDAAMPPGVVPEAAANVALPADVPIYPEDAPPCFIGHYWMKGIPSSLASNVACVDYSVAKGGKLVAYRWNQERQIDSNNFYYVQDIGNIAGDR